jgi:hypothetical protein
VVDYPVAERRGANQGPFGVADNERGVGARAAVNPKIGMAHRVLILTCLGGLNKKEIV